MVIKKMHFVLGILMILALSYIVFFSNLIFNCPMDKESHYLSKKRHYIGKTYVVENTQTLILYKTLLKYCGMLSDSVYSIKPARNQYSVNAYFNIREDTIFIYDFYHKSGFKVLEVNSNMIKLKLLSQENKVLAKEVLE